MLSIINSAISMALLIVIASMNIASENSNNTVKVNISNNNEWDFLAYINTDPTAIAFSATILTISTAVLFFAIYYMAEENKNNEFNIITILFVSSMIAMVWSPNIISIMLGWDGLGLTSFCLVMFYQNQLSLASGILTVLSNRVGDVAMLWLIAAYNEQSWSNTQCSMTYKMLIVTAAITKSAQLPFSAWLPAAMAAPTPTSSLVHSSTLVTAGIWLVNRFTITTKCTITNKLLLLSAIMTTIMAGKTATVENDMNNIVAISTLSQLGMIMITSALAMNSVTMLHTNVHAIFKALLFITVGSMMENNEGSQVKKNLSGQESKTSYVSLNAATMTLISLPITSSFFSNDVILEVILQNGNTAEALSLITTAVLTTSYSLILIRTMSETKKSSESNEKKASLGEIIITTAMVITSVLIPELTENGVQATNGNEKLLWLTILVVAINNSNKVKCDNESTIFCSSKLLINESSSNNNKNQSNDKVWLNYSATGLANVIVIVNEENKKITNTALAAAAVTAIILIN